MAARIVVCAAYPCKYNYSDNKKGRPAMILLPHAAKAALKDFLDFPITAFIRT